jgi:hypothetical protein
MDTPSSTNWPRRLRIAGFTAALALVSATLGYLLTWIDPPREPAAVRIHVEFRKSQNENASRHAMTRLLNDLAARRPGQPLVLSLRATALLDDQRGVCILPEDATIADSATWLPLKEILEKLRACPARQKLLVLELSKPPLGSSRHDIARALPRELDAVPDARRLVLCANSAGQPVHDSLELGRSPFAHYVQAALVGHADGHGDLRDGRVSVKELAAFVKPRVERWSDICRGERQSPVLLGVGEDFALTTCDPDSPRAMPGLPAAREYSDLLLQAWKDRDADWQSGAYRLMPRAFQWQQAQLLTCEQHGEIDNKLLRTLREVHARVPSLIQEKGAGTERADKFAEQMRALQQQLRDAKPEHVEVLKKRFIDDVQAAYSPTQLDTAIFAHALQEPRLDPGMIRLCDQILHPRPSDLPRTPETLRLRQLADLAMRVEVQAWPREIVETMLRGVALEQKCTNAVPALPGYVALLDEPARKLHAGEIRLWSRGYADMAETKKLLTEAAGEFERIDQLNRRYAQYTQSIDELLMEAPWYLEAMEVLQELREPWLKSLEATRTLAETMRNDRTRLDDADKAATILARQRQALHAPFAKDALARLERQCRSPSADASVRRHAEAVLSVAAPVIAADDRASLWAALHSLSRRLNESVLALDRQDAEPVLTQQPRVPRADQWHVQGETALRDLAGAFQEIQAWLNPTRWSPESDTALIEARRRDLDTLGRWQRDHNAALADDYAGFNFESAGIRAARSLYANAIPAGKPSQVSFAVSPVDALTQKQPYTDGWIEITRRLPAGAFGPAELKFHRADDAWLDIAPNSATLPALDHSDEPRVLTQKVPFKATRREKAERTGLPVPLGFLAEARFEGRVFHALVTVPIVPLSQQMQILVSSDADDPATTVNEIRLRPGNVKQPHYIYVRNLTNRNQKVHVEVKAGDKLVYQSQRTMNVDPDGTRRVSF